MSGARSRGVVAVATSAGLSLAATVFLLLWPCWGISVSVRSTGPADGGPPPEIRCHSLVSAEGWWVLGLLSVPMVLSLLGLLAVRRGDGGLVWGLAALLFLFCGIGAFSVGLYYVPSLAALVTSAVRMRGQRTAPDVARLTGGQGDGSTRKEST